MCKGESCTVDLEECGDKKLMGSFHTHPSGGDPDDIYYVNLSEGDIEDSISNNESFACIGLVQKQKPTIKCYLPYYGVDNNIAIDTLEARDNFDKKMIEYNPSKTQEGINSLPLSKSVELHKLFTKYLTVKKRLDEASDKAFHKLRSEPNDGADLIMEL